MKALRRQTVLSRIEKATRPRVPVVATPLSGGPEGPAGTDGRNAGLKFTYLTNTESSDPGSGKLKFNKATLSEATSLRISETDGDGNALAAYVATWDDSTSTVRGHLTMRKDSNPAVFAVFSVSGTLTDNGTWDTFTVAYVAGSGAFANNDVVKVEFRPKGDKGDAGATGETGREGPAGAATMADFKESVRAATTANITISTALNPGDTLDGVVLAENDRVLVKDQTTTKENGIWIVRASPARATDADAAGELSGGTTVYVEEGTRNKRRVFTIVTAGSITPGTTSHEWKQLQARDFGLVEALPTSEAVAGDRCTYKADKTNGVLWELVYDGEGEYPWKKIGGPPLVSRQDTQREVNNTGYVSPTTPATITVPLKGDYDVTMQSQVKTFGKKAVFASYSVGATAANDIWAAVGFQNTGEGEINVSAICSTRQTGVASGAEIVEKVRASAAGAFFVTNRRLLADPVRVG